MAYIPPNPNGQASMANSSPVVISSDQSAITVDTELPVAATIAADGVTPTVPGLAAYNFIKTPGANTWDRQYSVVNATNSTGTGIMATGILAQFDDVSPTAISENQFGNLRMSANRNQYVTIRDAAGNERGLNIDASGQVAVTLASAQTLATVTTVSTLTNITNWGNIVDNAAFTDGTTRLLPAGYIFDEVAGTALTENDAAAARIDSKRAQVIVIEDATTRGQRMTITTRGSQLIEGPTASGSSIAAAPVTTGGRAATANPTAVSDGQVVNATYDKLGKQVVVGSIRDLKVNQITTITSSTSETTIGTAVASTFLDLYGLIISNTSATAVNVAIKDSTAGTTQLNISVPAGETRGFMLPESGAIKQGTVNNNWTATSSGSVASLVITALFVKNT